MTELNLNIVKFKAGHVAEVAAIEAASFRDPWSEHSFHELLSLTDTNWVALAGSAVAGYLVTQWVLDEIHILNIAVRSDFRRQGISAKLLQMLLDLGEQRGMRDVFLEVRVSNVSAQGLYQKHGFSVLAVRKRYYPDGEDALIMYRALAVGDELSDTAAGELRVEIGDEHGD